MQKTLNSNNSDYLSIVENSPDFITRYDRNLRYLYINAIGLRTLRMPKENILGKTHRESGIYKAEQCDFMEEKIRSVFETGKQFNDQFEWESIDGPIWLHLMLTAEYDSTGKISSVLGFSRDITKYKHDEKALYESEEIFHHFMEHSPIYVFFKDSEIRSLRLSKNYEQMLGRPLEDLLGKSMDDLFPSDLAKKMIEDDKRILHKGKLEIIEEELNGRYYITYKYPIFINGYPKYLAGYTIDITDPKKAELKLQNSNRELEISKAKTSRLLEDLKEEMAQRKKVEEQISKLNTELEQRVLERTRQLEAANNELEAFAYSVSHDLRAPLRAVDGFSKFLSEGYESKLDTEGKRLLDLIRGNTKKMDQLITDILGLSRVSRSEHKASLIDMTKMVISMLNESVPDEKLAKIKVNIDVLPEAFADPTYMKQVWINLISNAVKFSSKRDKPEISIGGYLKNGYNVYSISDNGVGFNPEYKNKLFGVFQRLHKTDEFEGTGVGLAIVQRIIQRHGGEVWAKGEEGQGATFYFSLPSKSRGER
jgi:PAS domain S-box-containing protein